MSGVRNSPKKATFKTGIISPGAAEDPLATKRDTAAKYEVRETMKNIEERIQAELTNNAEVINYRGTPKVPISQQGYLKKKKNDEEIEIADGFLPDDEAYRGRKQSKDRFDVYLEQKEQRMRRLKQEYLAKEKAAMRDKPEIGDYDSEKPRTPIHLRDGGEILKKRQDAYQSNIQNKASQELDECTFSPELRSKNKGEADNGRTAEALLEWKKERDERVALLRMAHTEHDTGDCTFQPQISEKSRKIMSSYNNGAMPIKKGKKEFVEEFMKREKQDLFKPKINQNARSIVENGYTIAPPRQEIKPLSPKKKLPSKSPRSTSIHKNKPTIHKPRQKLGEKTEDEIILKYRKEATPRAGFGKMSAKEFGYSVASDVFHLGKSQSRSKVRQMMDSPRRSRSPLSASRAQNYNYSSQISERDFARADKIARNAKLNHSRSKSRAGQRKNHSKSKYRGSRSPTRSRSPDHYIEQTLNSAHSAAISPRNKSPTGRNGKNNLPYHSKQPSQNRFFDDRMWYEYVKEQNEENARKKIDGLIYHDDLATESVQRSPGAKSPKNKSPTAGNFKSQTQQIKKK